MHSPAPKSWASLVSRGDRQARSSSSISSSGVDVSRCTEQSEQQAVQPKAVAQSQAVHQPHAVSHSQAESQSQPTLQSQAVPLPPHIPQALPLQLQPVLPHTHRQVIPPPHVWKAPPAAPQQRQAVAGTEQQLCAPPPHASTYSQTQTQAPGGPHQPATATWIASQQGLLPGATHVPATEQQQGGGQARQPQQNLQQTAAAAAGAAAALPAAEAEVRPTASGQHGAARGVHVASARPQVSAHGTHVGSAGPPVAAHGMHVAHAGAQLSVHGTYVAHAGEQVAARGVNVARTGVQVAHYARPAADEQRRAGGQAQQAAPPLAQAQHAAPPLAQAQHAASSQSGILSKPKSWAAVVTKDRQRQQAAVQGPTIPLVTQSPMQGAGPHAAAVLATGTVQQPSSVVTTRVQRAVQEGIKTDEQSLQVATPGGMQHQLPSFPVVPGQLLPAGSAGALAAPAGGGTLNPNLTVARVGSSVEAHVAAVAVTPPSAVPESGVNWVRQSFDAQSEGLGLKEGARTAANRASADVSGTAQVMQGMSAVKIEDQGYRIQQHTSAAAGTASAACSSNTTAGNPTATAAAVAARYPTLATGNAPTAGMPQFPVASVAALEAGAVASTGPVLAVTTIASPGMVTIMASHSAAGTTAGKVPAETAAAVSELAAITSVNSAVLGQPAAASSQVLKPAPRPAWGGRGAARLFTSVAHTQAQGQVQAQAQGQVQTQAQAQTHTPVQGQGQETAQAGVRVEAHAGPTAAHAVVHAAVQAGAASHGHLAGQAGVQEGMQTAGRTAAQPGLQAAAAAVGAGSSFSVPDVGSSAATPASTPPAAPPAAAVPATVAGAAGAVAVAGAVPAGEVAAGGVPAGSATVGAVPVGAAAGAAGGERPVAAALSGARFVPRGLSNPGNVCFLNATLQALVGCGPFAALLRDVSRQAEQQQQRLVSDSVMVRNE